MARQRRTKIHEPNIRGLQSFDKLSLLLERLQDDDSAKPQNANPGDSVCCQLTTKTASGRGVSRLQQSRSCCSCSPGWANFPENLNFRAHRIRERSPGRLFIAV